mmetsp:Transcript_14619/g.22044  ORF Transcript_14619/g.22044 Transcript_14619/m.22044 type:complete len:214 (-) Transcript_14619:2973-3614(-)
MPSGVTQTVVLTAPPYKHTLLLSDISVFLGVSLFLNPRHYVLLLLRRHKRVQTRQDCPSAQPLHPVQVDTPTERHLSSCYTKICTLTLDLYKGPIPLLRLAPSSQEQPQIQGLPTGNHRSCHCSKKFDQTPLSTESSHRLALASWKPWKIFARRSYLNERQKMLWLSLMVLLNQGRSIGHHQSCDYTSMYSKSSDPHKLSRSPIFSIEATSCY